MSEKTCSVEDCATTVRARGWCNRHWFQWRKYGDPTRYLRRSPLDTRAILEAGSNAATDECIYMSSPQGQAPRVWFNGKRTLAARAVWIMTNGDPGKLLVLHACSEGAGSFGCVNVRHLYLGDAKANAADKIAAGRAANAAPDSPPAWAIITREQAREIRERYAQGGITYARLGEIYGIKKSAVGSIVRGVNWKTST